MGMYYFPEIGDFFYLIFWLGLAVCLAVLSFRIFHEGYELISGMLGVLSFMAFLYPFWDSSVGVVLAEKMCRENSSEITYTKLPLISEGNAYHIVGRGLDIKEVVDHLTIRNYKYIDEFYEAPPSRAHAWKPSIDKHETLSYQLVDKDSEDCGPFEKAIDKNFANATNAYQYGIRHNQCITVKVNKETRAKYFYKTGRVKKRFPIYRTVDTAGYYDSLTKKPLVEKNVWYYRANILFDRDETIACHHEYKDLMVKNYLKGFFIGRGGTNAFPKRTINYTLNNVSVENVSVDIENLGTNEYLPLEKVSKIRSEILGFNQNMVRVWRLGSYRGEKDALIFERNGEEHAIILPEYNKYYANPYSGGARIHALTVYKGNYILVRGDDKARHWEVMTYSVLKNTLKREFLPIRSIIHYTYQSSQTVDKDLSYAAKSNDLFLTDLQIFEKKYVFSGYVVATTRNTSKTRVLGEFEIDTSLKK